MCLTAREWRPHKVENEKNDTKWHCLYDFISRQLAIFCAQLYNDSGHDLIENHNYGTVIYEIVRSWRWKWEMKKVRQKEYWAPVIAINKKSYFLWKIISNAANWAKNWKLSKRSKQKLSLTSENDLCLLDISHILLFWLRFISFLSSYKVNSFSDGS